MKIAKNLSFVLIFALTFAGCAFQREKNDDFTDSTSTKTIPTEIIEIIEPENKEKVQVEELNNEILEYQENNGFENFTNTNLPDEFGYYFLENDKYWNIPMLMDIPKRLNEVSLIFDVNYVPRLFFHSLEEDYIPNIFLTNLITEESIEFKFDSTDQKDFYEIKSQGYLGSGFYCFNQDLIYFDRNNVSWCFVVVDPAKLVSEIDNVIVDEEFKEMLEVPLPNNYYGAFVVALENENDVIELPPVDPDLFSFDNTMWDKTFNPDDFLNISTKKPVILIRSEKIQFIDLFLKNYLFTLGFETDWSAPELVVNYVFPTSNVDELGVNEGDILIYRGNRNHDLFRGQLGELAAFDWLKGTSSKAIQIKYDLVRWISGIEFSYEFMEGGYVRIIPKDRLESGLYCLEDKNFDTNEYNLFSCFYVNE